MEKTRYCFSIYVPAKAVPAVHQLRKQPPSCEYGLALLAQKTVFYQPTLK